MNDDIARRGGGAVNRKDIDIALGLHRMWLRAEKGGQRANFRGADLRDAFLSKEDLFAARMERADMSGSNLSLSNLGSARLLGADLRGTDLRGADLRGAELRGADLRGANLRGANLILADLRDADLSGADLRYTDMDNATLPDDCVAIQLGRWPVFVTRTHTSIGCEFRSNDEWISMSDVEIRNIDDCAAAWSQRWRPVVLSLIEDVRNRQIIRPHVAGSASEQPAEEGDHLSNHG